MHQQKQRLVLLSTGQFHAAPGSAKAQMACSCHCCNRNARQPERGFNCLLSMLVIIKRFHLLVNKRFELIFTMNMRPTPAPSYPALPLCNLTCSFGTKNLLKRCMSHSGGTSSDSASSQHFSNFLIQFFLCLQQNRV